MALEYTNNRDDQSDAIEADDDRSESGAADEVGQADMEDGENDEERDEDEENDEDDPVFP